MTRLTGFRSWWITTVLGALLLNSQALAHPHVFVDGGVDFELSQEAELTALRVTWLYDEFETLYILAAHEMGLNDQGMLDEQDRLELVQRLSQWPEDFDGSAHLSLGGQPVALMWPQDLDVQLRDGRLQLTFVRPLEQALNLSGQSAEVAFFESTFFFDFTITQAPNLLGDANRCRTNTTPFKADRQDQGLLDALAKLSREETSGIDNVGALFADRITLTCD